MAQVVPDAQLINLPGCPVNVANLTATIVHYLTFKQFPATDSRHRPLFAYGGLIHNQCERRAHFEFGEFALAWGDEASQKGWCLYKMGCKGPETFSNCPTVRYAERHELAGQGRPRLRRLHHAAVLGRHEPVLPAAPVPAAVRADSLRRQDRPGAGRRRRGRDHGARCGEHRPAALEPRGATTSGPRGWSAGAAGAKPLDGSRADLAPAAEPTQPTPPSPRWTEMARIAIDPITRIGGHLRIEVEVADGVVRDAWSSGTMFRGMELDPQGP